MTPPYRKKLIEVALPLEAINVASAREKSIRHGHPSTLHLWWARRPLAACRAVLFASLVDDPDSDPTFRRPDGTVDEDRAGVRRAELFNLIEELVQWENSNNEKVINAARAEIAASVASRKVYDTKEWTKEQIICGQSAWNFVCRTAKPQNVNAFLAEHTPPVLDPFCGGGSIPLEAQRLGLRAYASDLNPVPVLITKALIEIPPKFAGRPPVNPESRGEAGPAGKKGTDKGKSVFEKAEWRGAQGLAEDVRYYGKWMRDEAKKRIGHLYPKVEVTAEMAKDRPDLKPYVGEELTVIAWIWARTVASPNPTAGGAHVPLVRSFWLGTKPGKEAWIRPVVNREKAEYAFDIRAGKPQVDFDPGEGTVSRQGARCLITGSPMPFPYVRAEGKAGRLGQRLMAIVAEGVRGRAYLPANNVHVACAQSARATWRPEGDMPKKHRNFQPPVYGMNSYCDIFTERQLVTLTCLADLISSIRERIIEDARQSHNVLNEPEHQPSEYADAVATYLALAIDRLANYATTLCTWHSGIKYETLTSTFGRQALPMTWDFAEGNPFSGSSGNIESQISGVVANLMVLPAQSGSFGQVSQRDAASLDMGEVAISTDPPYYDNIGYADLSDFFYIWLRRSLGRVYPSLFSTLLSPKSQELIAAPHRHDGDQACARDFFEKGLTKVFARMRQLQSLNCPLILFYAFKQVETDEGEEASDRMVASTGWETMLEGLVGTGFMITGTWPMRTELTGNLKKNMAALASSVVLSCVPRPESSAIATRRDLLSALKRELPSSLRKLQSGSIAPVDLAQAAIGPGMAVFTRYTKVMEADGSPMNVRQALALINQTLDEVLAEQEGEFDGDTRWAIAWFEQFGMEDGQFGVAETLSKAKNTAVNGLVEAGIIAARAGKVRLLKRDELPADWNPATDNKVRHWEVTQHLIRALETGGEPAAADLLRKLGGVGEIARDLAYRLYSLCERKKWAADALAYNSLVIAWPEISKLARSGPQRPKEQQGEMF